MRETNKLGAVLSTTTRGDLEMVADTARLDWWCLSKMEEVRRGLTTQFLLSTRRKDSSRPEQVQWIARGDGNLRPRAES
ncbi:hypothetical protein VTJ04DRAFT_6488 [Mycothermus thermophilus]|uniref:uncharacterized protein n=1 Tax=Humicola insolens TaxID=85995 RepID=UPI0037430F51